MNGSVFFWFEWHWNVYSVHTVISMWICIRITFAILNQKKAHTGKRGNIPMYSTNEKNKIQRNVNVHTYPVKHTRRQNASAFFPASR